MAENTEKKAEPKKPPEPKKIEEKKVEPKVEKPPEPKVEEKKAEPKVEKPPKPKEAEEKKEEIKTEKPPKPKVEEKKEISKKETSEETAPKQAPVKKASAKKPAPKKPARKTRARKGPNIGIDVALPKKDCNDRFCPFHGTLPVRGQILEGVVMSDRMQGSAVVKREYMRLNKKFERLEKRSNKYLVHSPSCLDVKEGDKVKIMECRPLSKNIAYVVIENSG